MHYNKMMEMIRNRYPSRLMVIDSHTAGEPTRLIVGGVDRLPGDTMEKKRRYFMEQLDHVRLQLTREPRGHRGMLAALVTDPVTQGAHFGLIYMNAGYYPYLCGHATIGAVVTLIKAGVLQTTGEENRFIVDTPSGPMETRARMRSGAVDSVAIRMVPSFVYRDGDTIELPGTGPLSVATVYVGGFFAMVSSDQIGLSLEPANADKLIELGMAVTEAANRQLTVRHPTRPEVTTVDVTEFYDPSCEDQGKGRSVVVYGERHIDRSPCGTGTTAKMTLLHHRGRLELNEPYVNTSPLGTTFEGRLIEKIRIGDQDAVVAEIRGQAHITGIHEFVLDPGDPFPEGFLL
jgi:proline racemase